MVPVSIMHVLLHTHVHVHVYARLSRYSPCAQNYVFAVCTRVHKYIHAHIYVHVCLVTVQSPLCVNVHYITVCLVVYSRFDDVMRVYCCQSPQLVCNVLPGVFVIFDQLEAVHTLAVAASCFHLRQ